MAALVLISWERPLKSTTEWNLTSNKYVLREHFSAKCDTGTFSDLNMVYLQCMRQINDCISWFVMGMGWLTMGTSIWFGDHENPLFNIFDYICLYSRRKFKVTLVFGSLISRTFFFVKQNYFVCNIKWSSLLEKETIMNVNRCLQTEKKVQAFCFISWRNRIF